MKVITLKQHLATLPDDSIVYLSSDAEGNNFAELSEDVSYTGNSGAVILYPLHEMVEVGEGYCKQCEVNQITINGDCAVCGQLPKGGK